MNSLSQSTHRTRRDFLKSSSLLLGAAAVSSALPRSLFAQDDAQRLDQLRKQLAGPVQVSKLSGNVYVLSGAVGNIGVLTGAEDKFVVDCGLLPSTPAVLQALG